MRDEGDPPSFVGFYWNRIVRGRVVDEDKRGPFPCYSAAAGDAYTALQLKHARR